MNKQTDLVTLERRAKAAEARLKKCRLRIEAQRAALEAAIGGVVVDHLDDPMFRDAAIRTREALSPAHQTLVDELLKRATQAART